MSRLLLIVLLVASCMAPSTRPSTRPSTAPSEKFRLGTIRADAIRECSGVVASRTHPGVFWVHNDSGNSATLYAITRDGELIREFPVAATNTDWEDIAIDGDGHLYIGDVGNNQKSRREVAVYRVDEPDPRAAAPRGRPAPLRVSATWRLTFPDKPFDCESLFVLDGKGYVITKRRDLEAAAIYRFDLAPQAVRRPSVLERVVELPSVHAPVTAADVSADGKRLAVLTVAGPYVFDINGDVARAGKVTPRYSRYLSLSMESACFVPEGVLATTESRDVLLFREEYFKPASPKRE